VIVPPLAVTVISALPGHWGIVTVSGVTSKHAG
jgi:hypothetical protein